MKKLNVKNLLLALLVIFLSACEKQSPSDLNDILPQNISSKWGSAENSSNPYETDSVGYMHNEAIDFIIRDLSNYNDVSDAFSDLDSIAIDAFENVFDRNLSTEELSIIDSMHAFLSINSDSLINSLNCPTVHTVTQEYLDSVDVILDFDYSTYQDFYDDIVALEDSIENDELIPSDESEALLQMCSLARYSIYYWSIYGSGKLQHYPTQWWVKNADSWGFVIGTLKYSSPISGVIVGALWSFEAAASLGLLDGEFL